MRNCIKIFLLAAASVTLGSCDQFLEMKTPSDTSQKRYNTTPEEIAVSIAGCYNGMQGALHAEWALTELRSDNARIYARASSTLIFEYIHELDYLAVSTTNTFIDEYWTATYANIGRCNQVLADMDVVTDPVANAVFSGEAMFIRAYHYFNLVRLWGGVFLITEPITPQQARVMQRTDPEAVYAQIEGDLEDIIEGNMLPESYPKENAGRVTMTAAKALLAKVYMTHYLQGSAQWAAAKPLLEGVITAVGDPQAAADLVPFDKIFDVNNEMNDEIIFAVRYRAGNTGTGSPFGNEFAPSQSDANVINGSGSSYNYPSTSIIQAFNANGGTDLRKDVSLAEKYYDKTTGQWKDQDITTTCRYVKKYLSPVTTVKDGESDWPVLRVADALLLYAELCNEQGEIATAAKYVDLVRARAGVVPLENEQKANSYVLRGYIRNERRLELAFENQRWFDMLRWGIATTDLHGHFLAEDLYLSYTSVADRPSITAGEQSRTILPIPFNVMNINPELPQNVGY